MDIIVNLVLGFATIISITGISRFSIGIRSHYWYNARCEELNRLPTFNCTKFHEIQSKPKPWYVQVNDWLEERHV